MRKFKFFLNFNKEEKWLNKMANIGYRFAGKSFGYIFETAQPEDTNIRIDYRQFKTRSDFEDYCALFEDSGWIHIAGSRYSGAQYFKQVQKNAKDDIFSDRNSKAGRYKRLSELYLSMAVIYLPMLIALMSTGTIKLSSIFNVKSLYFTEGLWERTGAEFWRAFLFETPFALIRGISWSFIPIVIILFLIFSMKADHAYRKEKNI